MTSFIKVNFLELAPAKDGKNEKTISTRAGFQSPPFGHPSLHQLARSQRKRLPMNPTLTTLVLISFLPLPSFSYSTFPSAACLRSCSSCKQMYGGNFKGHLCARSCFQSIGSSWRPVCTDLPSISGFLDMSSLATFRWSDDEI